MSDAPIAMAQTQMLMERMPVDFAKTEDMQSIKKDIENTNILVGDIGDAIDGATNSVEDVDLIMRALEKKVAELEQEAPTIRRHRREVQRHCARHQETQAQEARRRAATMTIYV